MPTNWRDVLVAYLHDPPDKALQIPGHEARARNYLQAAVGDRVSEAELKDPSDPRAAMAERLPAPNWQTLTVSCEQGLFRTRHPLSAAANDLAVPPLDPARLAGTIGQVTAGIDDTERRFLVLWRNLREALSRDHGAAFAHLPADTRIPDHTIWHHLDATTAFKAADGPGGAAFLSFSVGPVQSFIEAARSLRDLWSGSMVLAWLTFQGMLPVIKRLGPTALVYPAVRGLPWLDRWLREEKQLGSAIKKPSPELLCAPCIPNRFLALVPWGLDGGEALDLAAECRRGAHEAWRRIAESVHVHLDARWRPLDPAWDLRWDEQIESFFDLRTAVLPWRACGGDEEIGRLIAGQGGFDAAFPGANAVRGLADAIPKAEQPGYSQKSAGNWQAKVELSARLMQAQRAVRHVPPSTATFHGDCPDFRGGEGREPGASAIRRENGTVPLGGTECTEFPPKCSLLGSYEQMGPAGLDNSREFWEKAAAASAVGGVRLRKRERFSAVALVKRYCGPCFFGKELDLHAEDIRYEDTATVAAVEWLDAHPELKAFSRERGSQWLHWSSPTQGVKEDGDEQAVPKEMWSQLLQARRKEAPPAYYAVLMMDGDEMGRWLRGDKSPAVREVFHPRLEEYFKKLPGAAGGLDAKRPVSPALHAAISEALANFAVYFARPIVEQHRGRLIYAGGDDVLALLPARTALACARELHDTFRENWMKDDGGAERLLMGERASVSAGLAVVHYKEDLRFALEAARKAEKKAKSAGRDALQITVCRRSGEHASALCPWDFIKQVENWVRSFSSKPEASARDASQPEASARNALKPEASARNALKPEASARNALKPEASARDALKLEASARNALKPEASARDPSRDPAHAASDRWAYHLRAELETLRGLPVGAMQAEIKRQMNRADEPTRRLFGEGDNGAAGRRLTAAFEAYRTATRPPEDGKPAALRFADDGEALSQFITLCQSASFLARGRDQ